MDIDNMIGNFSNDVRREIAGERPVSPQQGQAGPEATGEKAQPKDSGMEIDKNQASNEPNEEIRIQKALKKQRLFAKENESLRSDLQEAMLELARLKGQIEGVSPKEDNSFDIDTSDLSETERILLKTNQDMTSKLERLMTEIADIKGSKEDAVDKDAEFLKEQEVDLEDFKVVARSYLKKHPTLALAYQKGELQLKDLYNTLKPELDEITNPNTFFGSRKNEDPADNGNATPPPKTESDVMNEIFSDLKNPNSETRGDSVDKAVSLVTKGLVDMFN